MNDSRAIVTRFTEAFLGRGDIVAADELLHPEVQVVTGLKPTGPIDGADEYKSVFLAFLAAFSPVEPLAIIDQFATVDRVMTRFQARLRHVADYFGVPATERVVLFDETHVARVCDGRIVENVVSATNLEFEMLMADALRPMILGAN